MSCFDSLGVDPDAGSDPGFASILWPWFSGFDLVAVSFGFGSLCAGTASGV